MSGAGRFAALDGLSLAYRDEGPRDAPPVLCLAGLTRSGRDFDHFAAAAPEMRLIRLDSRGRGDSDHDPEWRNYAVPVEARDALALLDHLGLARAGVLGVSRGGLLAMAMAATARDRLLGVALIDVGPVIEPAAITRIMAYVGSEPGFADLDAAAEAHERLGATDFPGFTRADWRAHAERTYRVTPEGLRLNYDPRLADALAEQARELAEAEAPPDLWPLFDALAGLPLLIIRGENSDLLSAATLSAMLERHPEAEAVTAPGRGHTPRLDEPESVAALRRWLGKLAKLA